MASHEHTTQSFTRVKRGFAKQHRRLHCIWSHIKRRCYTPKNHAYHRYGGRGITLCDAWHDFAAFVEWALQNGYTERLTIDRRENDGNYEPDNCRWVTYTQNNRNRRDNKRITFQGKTLTAPEWAEITDITEHSIRNRIGLLGWSVEKALTTKEYIQQERWITHNGETLTLGQWATRLGILKATLANRLGRSRWSVERALTEPINTKKSRRHDHKLPS